MKTLVWFLVLITNLGVVIAFAPLVLESDAPNELRVVGAIIVLLYFAVCAFLIAARLNRLPLWGRSSMKLLCSVSPFLLLLGALDHGMVSGLEILSLVLVALHCWASWHAFSFYSPGPIQLIKADTSE